MTSIISLSLASITRIYNYFNKDTEVFMLYKNKRDYNEKKKIYTNYILIPTSIFI